MQQALVAQLRTEFADQRHIEGGAAHIAENRVAQLALFAIADRRADAAGRTGFEQHDRPVRDHRGAGKTAVRLHEQELAGKAEPRQRIDEASDIAAAHRAEHRVDHR